MGSDVIKNDPVSPVGPIRLPLTLSYIRPELMLKADRWQFIAGSKIESLYRFLRDFFIKSLNSSIDFY